MANSRHCDHCGNTFHPSAERCPHCANPGLFPNVFAAQAAGEREALEKRYKAANLEAESRGAGDAVREFEAAMAGSQAVIARPARELLRLATSDNEIYGTYYDPINAGLRLPAGGKWDILRGVVDSALFPNYKEQIRFAALSLDGLGLSNYGEYSITLRADMIAHRASVFEENSILFMKHHDIKIAEAHKLPEGYRATWNDRGRLCVAKLAMSVDGATSAGKYSGILLRQGATSEQDEFVEVHIWGPLTVRTIEEVRLTHPKAVNRATIKTIKAKLAAANVKVS
jgi:hypothetical protein